MRLIFFFVLVIHGLVHHLGFAKAFKLAKISQIKSTISKFAGVLWFLCTILFVGSGYLFMVKIEYWWLPAGIAIVLSQIVIIRSWDDAKTGTLFNVIILVPVIIGYLNAQPASFPNIYKAEVQKALKRTFGEAILTEADIKHLPPAVQKYLRFTGAVGKPKVSNCRARFTGLFKTRQEVDWIKIKSQQYDFFDDPARVFSIDSSMYGLPFDGLHMYVDGTATMQIRAASLIRVVNAKGREMDQSETVTLLNDMCLLAPATLMNANIRWEAVDPLNVKVVFTNKAVTVTALLTFNEKGALVNFSSDDRYYSLDGTGYKKYRWTTPVKEYREVNGRKVVSFAEAVWHTPQGQFTYAKFDLADIQYNTREFRMD